MNDNQRAVIGIILVIVGLTIAFMGGAMGHGVDNYFIGLLSYAGGFIIAFIGMGVLLKVYQKRKVS